MALPHYEKLAGVIDGVNVNFTTSRPYSPGSLSVYLNGQLQQQDCWTETDPSTGAVTVSFQYAPRVGEVVQAFYLDTTAALPGEEIEGITGVVRAVGDLHGTVLTGEAVTATVVDGVDLTGSVVDRCLATGVVVEVGGVTGVLRDCDE